MMTLDRLQSMVANMIRDADSVTDDLSGNRSEALRRFYGQPYGNEQEGRSSAVTTDVADTIDWIMPQLLRQFTGLKAPAQFVPVNAEDVEQAQDETRYCQHVYNQQNNGYLNTYSALHDLLLMKNGYLKIWWDETVEEEREEYVGLDEDQALMLLDDHEVEIIGVEVSQQVATDEMGAQVMRDTYNIAVKRKRTNGQTRIEAIPPENILVAPGWKSLDLTHCPFVCHRELRLVSDLVEDGHDYETIVEHAGANEDWLDSERLERFAPDEGVLDTSFVPDDDSVRQVWVYECYVRADMNGDGIAERLKVTLLGGADGVLLGEPKQLDCVPVVSLAAFIMPHKHHARSIYDLIGQLQDIKTALLRQMLDNVYLTNSPMHSGDPTKMDVKALMTPRPGGFVPTKNDAMINTLTVPFMGEASLAMIAFVDQMKEERSGVNKQNQGLDPAALKDQSIYGMAALMSAAMQKIEMVARNVGEGFAGVFRHIHMLVSKYDQQQRTYYLGEQFYQTDPRSWRKKRDILVTVGVGNTGHQEFMMAMQAVKEFQAAAIEQQGGAMGPKAVMVTAQHVYNLMVDMLEKFGIQQHGRYFADPSAAVEAAANTPEEEPPVDPAVQAYLADVRVKEGKAVVDAQVELTKHEDEMALKREQMEQDLLLKREQMELDYQLRLEELRLRYASKQEQPTEQVQA